MPAVHGRSAAILGALATLTAVLAACGGDSDPKPGPTGDPAGSPSRREVDREIIEEWECPFDTPIGAEVECGKLKAPEVRINGDERTVQVPFALLKSRSREPLPDPIVYLAGGPGENILDGIPFVYNTWFAPFGVKRDVVVFDIRGAGYSEPWLDCYEYYEVTYAGVEEGDDAGYAQEDVDALGECSARLQDEEDADLSAYRSTEAARDVQDLMRGLGYDEWNLFGVSYGTRLALTIMRDNPEGVRSVVLDSAFPPEVDFYGSGPAALKRALDEFFSECERDSVCRDSYPGLEARFYEAVERLDEEPAKVPVNDPYTGEPIEGEMLDGSRFIGLVEGALVASEFEAATLPDLIVETADEEYGLAGAVIEGYYSQGSSSTDGAYWSVQCAEELPFSSRAAMEASVAANPEIATYYDYDVNFYYEVCEKWGVEAAEALENEPVKSDIPTLVLGGQYDPLTPPEWGEQAAAKLDNGYFYVYPHLGHGVSVAHSCPFEMTFAFLDDPLSEPDSGCIRQMPSPWSR